MIVMLEERVALTVVEVDGGAVEVVDLGGRVVASLPLGWTGLDSLEARQTAVAETVQEQTGLVVCDLVMPETVPLAAVPTESL